MKVTINYETNADGEYPCCAKAEVRGEHYFGIGRTWDQAKLNLLKKINAVLSLEVPQPEEIEVNVYDEEMQVDLILGEVFTK